MEKDGANPGEAQPDGRSRKELKHKVLEPGETFGNFRVVRCLCIGLIANYYHMQHIRDLHDLTIGVFHERTAKDAKFLKRLQNLQKMAKGVDHEGIPKIRDCAEINERICLFLDPIKGQSLSQYFQTHATLNEQGVGVEATTHILAQLLGLLGYAHSQGLDHRDLDSEMIFMREDGGISLLGLGVKSALGTELFESIVSASVSPLEPNKDLGRLNSFDVVSPEYKSGRSEDFRVDLYCVGMIGYWLLTGRKPSSGEPEKPTTLVEGLPTEWDGFLQRLLERKQENRFQSCKMALFALQDIEDEPEPESEQAGFIQRQIDRIQVPKNILDRGEKATRAYRLALIGLVGITLTGFASFFLNTGFTDKTNANKIVAQRSIEGQQPQLIVMVQPSASKITFSAHEESFITDDGQLELRVMPGQYNLRATAPNHLEELASVEITGKGKAAPKEIRFDLQPAWADLQIRSEPGASVTVIDEEGSETGLGLTDGKGELSAGEKLFAGTYGVVVEKEGYAPILLDNQELTFGETSVIEAPLTPLPARLLVTTDPSGARISLNGKDVGSSPVTLDSIAPGDQYQVVAQLEGYRPVEKSVKANPGQKIALDLREFQPKSGELQLEATIEGLKEAEAGPVLEETIVLVGEQRYPFGSSKLKVVPAGDHTIRLSHPLYASEPKALSLADGEVRKMGFTLKPRPAQVQLILPDGFEPSVYLNGKEIQLKDETIAAPANVPVVLELRIENHLTMRKDFKLRPKQKVLWKVAPTRIPGPIKGQDWSMPYVGFQLEWIPPGQLLMGSPMEEQGRLPNEGEQTEVRFTRGFWAGAYEVTQARFRKIMDGVPSGFIGAKRPVDSVTWEEANAFCRKLTERERKAERLPEGYAYRLPTEAEWEHAARAGTTTPFHFGQTADTTYGNFRGVYPWELNDAQRSTETYGTEPVGSYSPNAYGLYDSHGNVSEWSLDAYSGRLPGGELTDPEPRTGGDRYTLRGGSWEDFAVRVRSAARTEARADTKSNAIGFRIFLAPEF